MALFRKKKSDDDGGDDGDFIRGDSNADGVVFAIIDALYILAFGFINGPAPPCMDAADTDDNGVVFAIIDALYLLSWGFTNGPEPPDPGPVDCGPDPSDDEVDCAISPDTCSP